MRSVVCLLLHLVIVMVLMHLKEKESRYANLISSVGTRLQLLGLIIRSFFPIDDRPPIDYFTPLLIIN